MKILSSLLGSLALPRAASLSLRSGAAEAAPVPSYATKPQLLEVQRILDDRISDCRADPSTCATVADNSGDTGKKIQNTTISHINSTQRELDIIISDFGVCKFADDTSFLSSFDERVGKHKDCRGRQVSADDLRKSCLSLQTSQQSLATTTCSSGIMGKSPSDLVGLCTPGTGVPVGPWLESMKATFDTTYREWAAARDQCTNATDQVRGTTTRCTTLGTSLSSVAASCDDELASLESFACSYASGNAGRCSAYDNCYNSAMARYSAKVAEVPSLIKTWKDSWVAAEQMKCFATAVDSAGAIDTAKMEVCKNTSLVDTSKITVTITKAPARLSCPDPSIFPGSSLYRTRLYSSLPAGVAIREPTLCLGWKGGCAARSTFDQAAVLLKYNSQYCKVQATGSLVCNGERGTFMFQQEDTSTCMGKVKLVMQPSGEACRYDPIAGLPSISCGARSVAGSPDFSATLSSNPLASNRNGVVTLGFAGTLVAPLTNFGKLSKNDYDAYFHKECFNGGKRGAFRGVYSVHENRYEDRSFEWNCAYTPDGFSGFDDTNWFAWTDWDANWQLECGSNEVITHVEAKHDNGKEDRQYHVMCGKTPQGMGLDARPWTAWTNTYDNPSTIDCGADAVLVGIKSENSNRSEDRIWAYRCATVSVNAPPQLSFQVEYATVA